VLSSDRIFGFDYEKALTDKDGEDTFPMHSPLQIRFFFLLIIIALTFFCVFIPFLVTVIFKSDSFYHRIGKSNSVLLFLGLLCSSGYHVSSVIVKDTKLEKAILLLLLIGSLCSLGIVYRLSLKLSFSKVISVLSHRVFFAAVVSLYFFLFLATLICTVKNRNSENSSSLSVVCIIIYGLVTLYVIGILKESYFAINPILLQIGGILQSTASSNDSNSDSNKNSRDILCYSIILGLLCLGLTTNLIRSNRNEYFGFRSEEDISEEILKTNKLNFGLDTPYENIEDRINE